MQQFIPFSPYMTAQQRLYQMEQQYPQLAQPQPQPQQQSNNFLMVLQVVNYIENSKQTSNDKILQELQNQNKFYLEQILIKLERLEERCTT